MARILEGDDANTLPNQNRLSGKNVYGWHWEEITLADRIFVYQHPQCRWQGDRDVNAALNILNEALRLIGQIDQVVSVVAATTP